MKCNHAAYLKFLPFEDVSISTTWLSRSARDGSVESSSTELWLKKRVDLKLWWNGLGGSTMSDDQHQPFFLSSSLRCAWLDNFAFSAASAATGAAFIFLEIGWAYYKNWIRNMLKIKWPIHTWDSYHWRKGVASTRMMALFTSVLVRTSSLFEAL